MPPKRSKKRKQPAAAAVASVKALKLTFKTTRLPRLPTPPPTEASHASRAVVIASSPVAPTQLTVPLETQVGWQTQTQMQSEDDYTQHHEDSQYPDEPILDDDDDDDHSLPDFPPSAQPTARPALPTQATQDDVTQIDIDWLSAKDLPTVVNCAMKALPFGKKGLLFQPDIRWGWGMFNYKIVERFRDKFLASGIATRSEAVHSSIAMVIGKRFFDIPMGEDALFMNADISSAWKNLSRNSKLPVEIQISFAPPQVPKPQAQLATPAPPTPKKKCKRAHVDIEASQITTMHDLEAMRTGPYYEKVIEDIRKEWKVQYLAVYWV